MSLNVFRRPVVVVPSTVAVSKARYFAKAVTQTTNYRDSRQTNAAKIQLDHFYSKLGEEAVAEVLRRYEIAVNGPDYTIYPGRFKSWDADLEADGLPLAVKTQCQTSAARYGLSWTFQYGKQRRDPIFQFPEYWVALVHCDDTRPGFPCRVFPLRQLRDLPFAPPRLARLRDEKKVVYAEQLGR